MQALDDTIAALGTPVLVRALGVSGAPTAAIGRWKHDSKIVEVLPSDSIRLALSLIDSPNAHDGRGTVTDRLSAASISVFSPSEGVSVAVRGKADVIQLFLNQGFTEAILDAPFDCPPMFALHDDWMRAAIMRLLVTSTSGGPDDAMMIEERLHELSFRLKRHATGLRNRTKVSQPMFRGGLAPAAFRRVEAMISMALDEGASPSIAMMAHAIGLSVTHFTRAFRQHTGIPPHKYLVRRRMDRAISLLRSRNIAVAEVADSVGFSTPAHFVASFRAVMGITPGALRAALAS